MQINLPYGEGFLTTNVPDNTKIIIPRENIVQEDGSSIVRQAMENPIGS